MRVVFNPASNHGKAAEKWARVVAAAPWLGALPRCVLPRLAAPFVAPDELRRFVGEDRDVIAAGGDGTVSLVANALLDGQRLGALGLGSSNDYHKPVLERIAGIPARLEFERAAPIDLGRVVTDGRAFRFVVGSSVGAIAEGARAVLDPGPFGRWLKRQSADLAIALAGVATVSRHRNLPAWLRIDDGPEEELELTSLTVARTVHFGGSMRYDRAVEPGRLGVYLCVGMGRARLASVFASVSLGRFAGLPRTRTHMARVVQLRADTPLLLEADGEVTTAREVRWEVLPAALLACP